MSETEGLPLRRPSSQDTTAGLSREIGLLIGSLNASATQEEVGAIAALPSRSALLIVHRATGAGERFLLDSDRAVAGRHPDADIFLDDVTVSRRHAEFLRDGTQFAVRDLNSLNGTYYEGSRVDAALLRDGSEVQVGKFRLTFYASRFDVPQPGQ